MQRPGTSFENKLYKISHGSHGRVCGSKGETVAHVVSECSKLAQTEYKRRHDNVARNIHWQLCGKCELERANNWYEQKPEGVVES